MNSAAGLLCSGTIWAASQVATACTSPGAIWRAMRAEAAVFALIVDAKDETARQFYLHHGFREFISRPMSLFLPVAGAARLLDVNR